MYANNVDQPAHTPSLFSIIVINSMPNSVVCYANPDHAQENIRPDLDPNCLTLSCFFEKVDFEKTKRHAKLLSMQRVYFVVILCYTCSVHNSKVPASLCR